MNIKRLKVVRDYLKTVKKKNFFMPVIVMHNESGRVKREHLLNHGCGTAACIAGYTVALFKKRKWLDEDEQMIWSEARELLDLTEDEANELFGGNWSSLTPNESGWVPSMEDLTPKQAVKEINRMIREQVDE